MCTRTTSKFVLVGLMGLALSNTAFAAVEMFNLFSHPAGSAQLPLYGLRLDGVDGDPLSIFTFDFDHAQSDMKLKLTTDSFGAPTQIDIFGTSYGGKDIGTTYDLSTAGVYTINFSYTANLVGVSSGYETTNQDVLNNTGSITGPSGVNLRSDPGNTSLVDTVYLVDKAASPSFHFIDGTHRGHTGLNGWGWMAFDDGIPGDGADINHVSYSDWLFTAEPVVPEPAAFIVWFLLGLTASCKVSRCRSLILGI